MIQPKLLCLFVLMALSVTFSVDSNGRECDVLIIGGGASGVAAAVEASRLGADVVLTESGPWLGGMLTAAGVSAIDGNYNMKAGIYGEFFRALVQHYGSAEALKTGWVSSVLFEPHVGEQILSGMVQKENVEVHRNTSLRNAERENGKWVCTLDSAGKQSVISTRILIDATELGDVAAMTGAPYDIGMESRHLTGEDIAPEEANNIIQDMTYVAVLKDYGKPVVNAEPPSYDRNAYLCCCINEHCISPSEPDRMWPQEKMLTYGKLPGNKYMINWPIEGNDYYLNIIEMPENERQAALQKAKDFTLGFVYFMQTELGMNTLGLPDDEFPTADRMPLIPYHRESRRIHGKVRFTLPHITDPYGCDDALYRTAIAVGDYPVDHHHARYAGSHELPRLYFHPVPSFGVPLGVMIPDECHNLIVAEKSISSSNIVNGATRLQPVVLQIGTAAGALAALAAKDGKDIDEVAVRDVQRAVLDAGGYLLPYLDVAPEHPRFKAYQRIGATGILRGEGRNEGWSNQTWLRTDEVLKFDELAGLKEFYGLELSCNEEPVSVDDVIGIARSLGASDHEIKKEMAASGMSTDGTHSVLRGDFAVFIDNLFHPFDRKQVDIHGNLKQ